MTSENKKQQKKKARERLAKSRVAARRATAQKEKKRKRELGKIEQKYRTKGVTIRNKSNQKRDEEIIAQLEHNLKILEALEQEMEREKEMKVLANKQLEAEGAHTLEEKVKLLGGQADKNVKKYAEIAENLEIAPDEIHVEAKDIAGIKDIN